MPKFKVGDRVKYVGRNRACIGAVGTVIHYSPNFVQVIWDKNSIDAGPGAKYEDNLEFMYAIRTDEGVLKNAD